MNVNVKHYVNDIASTVCATRAKMAIWHLALNQSRYSDRPFFRNGGLSGTSVNKKLHQPRTLREVRYRKWKLARAPIFNNTLKLSPNFTDVVLPTYSGPTQTRFRRVQRRRSGLRYWLSAWMRMTWAGLCHRSKCLSTTSTSNRHQTFLMINPNSPMSTVQKRHRGRNFRRFPLDNGLWVQWGDGAGRFSQFGDDRLVSRLVTRFDLMPNAHCAPTPNRRCQRQSNTVRLSGVNEGSGYPRKGHS